MTNLILTIISYSAAVNESDRQEAMNTGAQASVPRSYLEKIDLELMSLITPCGEPSVKGSHLEGRFIRTGLIEKTIYCFFDRNHSTKGLS